MTIYSFHVLYFGWAFIAGDGRDAVSSLVKILFITFLSGEDELPAYTIHRDHTMLEISECDMWIQHRSSIGIDWILVLAKIIDMSRTHRKVSLFNTTYEDPSPINIS